MIKTEVISDKEFIESYLKFNLSARPSIAWFCIKAFPTAKAYDKKALALEVLSQYTAYLEDLAMIYHAMKEKQKQPEKSFLDHFQRINIREKSKFDTEVIISELEDLENSDIDSIKSNLGLPDLKKMAISEEIKKTIIEYGDIEKANEQYNLDTRVILGKFKQILQNRVRDKNGNELPLVKMNNKIKHGYLVINSEDDDWIKLPIEFSGKLNNTTEIKFYWLECKEDKLKQLFEQMKILHRYISDFLNIYLLNEHEKE